jgi:hypothetical protein
MNALSVTATEEKIAQRINPEDAKRLSISGGVTFTDAEQVMSFSRMMALGGIALPEHLRGNVGTCLAVCFQAIEWQMSPFSVANKSYSVNNRLAFESQLIGAVILKRAPIRGRFKVEYRGERETRRCKVSADLADGTGTVDYETPEFGQISPKNSPLWKSDPDQQLFYFAQRSLCRRHFPDVILGVFDRDELTPAPSPGPRGGTAKPLAERLQRIADGPTIEHVHTGSNVQYEEGPRTPLLPADEDDDEPPEHDPDTGEIAASQDERDQLIEAVTAKAHEGGKKLRAFRAKLRPEQAATLSEEEWARFAELARLADNVAARG